MSKLEKFSKEKYFRYDPISNKSTCLLKNCLSVLASYHSPNLFRHLRSCHKDLASTITYYSRKTKNGTLHTEIEPAKKKKKLMYSKQLIIKSALGLVAVKNVPLKLFDYDEMKILMHMTELNFSIKLDKVNISENIKLAGTKIVDKIKSEIRNKIICVKFDVASYIGHQIVAVHCQIIKDGKFILFTLETIELNKKNVLKNLNEILSNLLNKYEIDVKQLHSITIDNGNYYMDYTPEIYDTDNFKRIDDEQDSEDVDSDDMDESNANENIENKQEMMYERIYRLVENFVANIKAKQKEICLSFNPCAVHMFHFAAMNVINLPEVFEKLEKIRKIIKEITNENNLKILQSKNIKPPSIDNPTLWGTTLNMIEELVEVKFIFFLEPFQHIDIKESLWLFVKDFIDSFSILYKKVIELQGSNLTAGDLYASYLVLKINLTTLTYSENSKLLINSLEFFKEKLFQNDSFTQALFVDGRFTYRDTPHFNIEYINNTKYRLKEVYNQICLFENKIAKLNANVLNDSINTPSSSNIPNIYSASSDTSVIDLEKFMEDQDKLKELNRIKNNISIDVELDNLMNKDRLHSSLNILSYWIIKQPVQQNLSKIAKIALSVPCTQYSMHRAFSAIYCILANRTNRMNTDLLNAILLIRLNKEMLDQINIE